MQTCNIGAPESSHIRDQDEKVHNSPVANANAIGRESPCACGGDDADAIRWMSTPKPGADYWSLSRVRENGALVIVRLGFYISWE
jgi:hypothetical protein